MSQRTGTRQHYLRFSLRWIAGGSWSLLFLLLLLLNGCLDQGMALTDPITLADLPPGIGRGYPVVSFSGIDNDAAGLTQSDPAPNFHMVLPDGKYLTLADLRGRPVLINFWATWCGPCRLEMPEIVAEASRNEELVVLAVNVQEELTQLQPFTEDFQMIMPVIQDSKAELRQLYEVTGMPTSVFIDRDGNIAAIWRGILTGPALHDFLAAIQ